MNASSNHALDLVKELRLRRWAREHYVPALMRGPNWHPVALDEMARRDEEVRSSARNGDATDCDDRAAAPGYGYVPLDPGGDWMLHAAHRGVPEPVIAGLLSAGRRPPVAAGGQSDCHFIPG